MNANPDDGRGAETPARTTAARRGAEAVRGTGRRAVTAPLSPHLIAPADRSMTAATLTQRLRDLGVAEVARTIEPRGSTCPPIAVAQLSSEKAAALRAAAGGTLIVEADPPLRAASLAMTPASVCAAATAAVAVPLGPGFTTTIQVTGQVAGQVTGQVTNESEEPIEGAVVELVGQQWAARGLTDNAGRATLTLPGEFPTRVAELLVKPRSGFWSLCRINPELAADSVNPVTLRPLPRPAGFGWAARAMRFDQLPDEYRGGGVRIALIDTGAATGHRQLGNIKRDVDATRGDDRTWSHDAAGHGTPCAGILAATGEADVLRGLCSDAELHICKLPPDADCGDLAAALDYCVETGIDIACVGFGCARGSVIVEQCIAAAKRRGVAVIAAAGSIGGAVQFPACSPQVLAVGAIGLAGTFPDDSLPAVLAEAVRAGSAMAAENGLFVPAFSCGGPELDLCAPGVAVLSCQSPDGYAACDGTSVAVPHVAALAALALAHRVEFRRASHDGRRVERLFALLKETAQPLGDPMRTGAGLPDAPRALGVPAGIRPFTALTSLGLSELRNAMRAAGLAEASRYELFPAPPRGPAMIGRAGFDVAPPFGTAANMAPNMSPLGGGPATDMRALKEAMLLAGLSASI